MSEENVTDSVTTDTSNSNEDGFVDALSAVLVIVIPVIAVVYWLSGLPTS